MSTKITKGLPQNEGEEWHVFVDVNDDEHVYIEFDSYGPALRIPVHIWNEWVAIGPIEKGSWG